MSINLTKPLRLRNDGGAQLQIERGGIVKSLTLNASGNVELDGTLIPTALTTGTITGSGNMNIDSGTLFVDAANDRVGIGTTAPAAKLDLGTATALNQTQSVLARQFAPADDEFRLVTRSGSGVAVSTEFFKVGIDRGEASPNAFINFFRGPSQTGGFLSFSTNNNTERMRIDSAGNVGIGTTAPLTNNLRFQQKLAIASAGATAFSGASINTYASSAPSASVLDLQRSKGTSEGSMTAVGSGDALGYLTFRGSDGTSFKDGAFIVGTAEGAPAGGQVPASMQFWTTNSAGTSSQRMSITSDGYLRMASGSGGIQFNGDTAAANALDDYEEGTWTPNFQSASGSFGALTFATRVGYYTKVGNLVTVYGRTDCTTTTIGTASGEVFISNLPFSSANVSGALVVAGSSIRPGGLGPFVLGVIMLTNVTRFALIKENGAGVIVSDLASGGRNDFAWTMTYAV